MASRVPIYVNYMLKLLSATFVHFSGNVFYQLLYVTIIDVCKFSCVMTKLCVASCPVYGMVIFGRLLYSDLGLVKGFLCVFCIFLA